MTTNDQWTWDVLKLIHLGRPATTLNCCRDVRPIHTQHYIMTDRQHQLIMSLFARCDEINEELKDLSYNHPRYIELLGAHKELVSLADKLKQQFNAEAEALRQVESRISAKVNINA